MLLLRPTSVFVASALAILSQTAVCAPNTEPIVLAETQLPTVYVTSPSSQKVSAHEQKITRQQLDRAGAEDLKNLLRYEPGVEVETQAGLGNGNFNIRGIAEDRVWVMVDDLNLPDSFQDSFWYARGGARAKNGMTFGQNLVETDTISQVNVTKGPFDAQYSGEAIGGSVNMRTYEAEDLLNEGKPWGVLLKSGYNSGNRGWHGTVGAAAANDHASALLMYTHRDFAANRTPASPASKQDNRSDNVLIKGALHHDAHQLDATFEHFKRQGDSEDLLSIDNHDHTQNQRTRASVQYQYRPEQAQGLQFAKLGYDYQDLDAELLQIEPSRGLLNRHLQGYQQRQHRGYLQGAWLVDAGVQHHLLAGTEYRDTQTSTSRHSSNYSLKTGAQVGAVDDLLYYPDNHKKIWSAFVQDRMVFDNGVSLTPALRYSHETSTPNRGDLPRLKNQAHVSFDQMVTGGSYSSWLPSLKLNVPLNEHNDLFASYARGYKAPQLDARGAASHSVLNGMIQYYNVPNFDLKPENSHHLEWGWQHQSEQTQAKLTAFYNQYNDFIEEGKTIRTLHPTGRPMPQIMELSAVNIGKVVTYGLEARGQYAFTPYWNVNGSLFWMRGINRDDDSHLNSALPLKARLGVAYANETWGANLDWTLSQAKTHYAKDDAQTPKTPGYGLVDVGGYWDVNKHTRLSLNAYNVFDKKYWLPNDMLWLHATTQLDKRDYYSQSGRAISAGVQIKF